LVHLSAPLHSSIFMHPPPPAIHTLSLHDALPISRSRAASAALPRSRRHAAVRTTRPPLPPCRSTDRDATTRCRASRWSSSSAREDRKSTRLNSSHGSISYAVFCLKKKRENKYHRI